MPPGIVLDGAEHGAKMGKPSEDKLSLIASNFEVPRGR
jgi:hypothetical protein